jgi:hypothetical protein
MSRARADGADVIGPVPPPVAEDVPLAHGAHTDPVGGVVGLAHDELDAAGLDVDVRWVARPSEVITAITAATATSDSRPANSQRLEWHIPMSRFTSKILSSRYASFGQLRYVQVM